MTLVRGWGRRLSILVTIALLAALAPLAAHAQATSGTTFTWGANGTGQLGRAGGGGATPAQLDVPLAGVTALDGGQGHTVALTNAGSVLAWGDNTFGQLGRGSFGLGASSSTPAPVALPSGVSATAIAAGANHVLAVGSDGNVYAWGSNTSAQLSLDPTTIALRATPVRVQGVSGAVAVAAGDGFSMALAGGVVYAWGDNTRGQLGTTQPSPGGIGSTIGVQPKPVAGLSGVTAIAAGASHALAVVDGSVQAWGDNTSNQLNDPATSGLFRLDPVATGVTGASRVAAGAAHSMALLDDGTVRTWGSNSNGQLGRGAVASGLGDPGLAGVRSIAAGGQFSLAVVADASTARAWSWGASGAGQLGRSTNPVTAPADRPGRVADPDTVVAIGAGTNHAAAAAAPRASLDPATLAFPGTTEVGLTSGALTGSIRNEGPGPLTVGALSFSGNGGEFAFSPGGDGCSDRTLAAGAACNVSIRFSPKAAGPRTGTLTVPNDGYDGPLHLALSGTATAVSGAIEISTGQPVYTVPASPTDIPLTDIPLQPTSPAVQEAERTGDLPLGPIAGIGDGLPLGPIAGIGDLPLGPIAGIGDGLPLGPIAGIGDGLPLGPIAGIGDGLPLGPIAGIAPATAEVLRSVPLAQVRLLAPYAWDGPDSNDVRFVLSGSPTLRTQPLQQLTLHDVVSDTTAANRLAKVPFAHISLGGSRLANVGVIALLLGRTPLSAMHAPGKTAAQTFCPGLEAAGYASCGAALGRTASGNDGLSASAVEMQTAGVPFTALPISDLLLGDIEADPKAPYLSVPLHRVDLYTSSLGGIRVGAVPAPVTVVSCAPGCNDQTLYEARGSLLASATVNSLGEAISGFTIGRLVTGLLSPTATDIGAVPLDSAGVIHYAAADGVRTFKVPYHVTYRNGQQSELPTGSTLSVDLPTSFAYVPGSTVMKVNGTTVATPPPAIAGATLTWSIDAPVAPGATLTVGFAARPGVRLGTFTVNRLEVRAVSTSIVATNPQAPVTVVDPADRDDVQPPRSNDTVATATPILPSTSPGTGNLAVGFISSRTDTDLYTFSADGVVPGSLIIAQLEHQTSGDADLSLFGAAGQTGLAPLRPVSGSASAELLPDAGVQLAAQGSSLVSDAQADLPVLDGRPVLGISRYSGTADETITAIAPAGATPGAKYVLQVVGYNGQSATTAYSLRVRIIPPTALPTAQPRFSSPQPSNTNVLPTMSALAGTRNLYLTAPGRMTKIYGTTATTSVTSALNALVNDSTLTARFGRSAVLEVDATPLGTDTSVLDAYRAWDANPGDPELANNVVRAVNKLVDSYRSGASLDLSSIVIVGGDSVIPQARVPDLTIKVNERDYASELAGRTSGSNELVNAAARGYFLSDDPFASFRPKALVGGQFLYVPSVAHGRLVEAPAQIAGTINRYRTAGGIASPSTALTTSATDFLDDMAAAINQSLAGAATTRAVLIDSPWTKASYSTGFRDNDIVSFNGHSDVTRTETRATRSTGEVFSTGDLLAGGGLDRAGNPAGAITFSVGCHTGQLATDALVTSGQSEWAQALAAKNAGAFVGQNGYGIGSPAGIAFTEQVMHEFATRIATTSLGRALVDAKRKVLADAGPLSPFHTKAAMQATLYGIPSLRLPNATAGDPGSANPPLATDNATGLPSTTITAQSTSPQQPGYFSLVRRNTVDGSYWQANGRTLSSPERPLQPALSFNVSSDGLTAAGVLVTALSSTEVADVDPVMPYPATTSAQAPVSEKQVQDVAWPASLQYLGEGPAGQDTLNLVTGMFNQSRLLNGKTVGRQVLFSNLQAKVLYAPAGSVLPAPPTLRGSRASLVNGIVTFSADVEPRPNDPVQQVLVLFKEPGSSAWKSLELVPPTQNLKTWTGGALASGHQIEYFVQAVGKSGRVAVLANKGRLLKSLAVPPPVGSLTTGITGTPAPAYGSNADGNFQAFFSTAHVTLTPPVGEYVWYQVDGSQPRLVTGPITFAGSGVTSPPPGAILGDGFRQLSYLSSAGASGTLIVRIDSSGPVLTITNPRPESFVPVNSNQKLVFSCTDNASGLKVTGGAPHCTATVNGAPVANGASLPTSQLGVHTIVVTGTDNAGYTTTRTSRYYTGYTFEGFLSPLQGGGEMSVNAGSTIPFKWKLYDGTGAPVTALSAFDSFGSYRYTCATTPPSAPPSGEQGTGSGISYRNDHYQYDWKTAGGAPPAGYDGTCRRAVVTLKDGTIHTADFRFN